MSAETVVLIAVGYVAILVVVLAMLTAAGRADRAAGRDADKPRRAGRDADKPRRAADAQRRFRRRRASELQEVASDRSPVQRRTR